MSATVKKQDPRKLDKVQPEHSVQVEVRRLNKEHTREDGASVRAVDDASFELVAGEFLCLLGASGSGKSSLLRCLAGLDLPDSGYIRVGKQVVFDSEKLKKAVAPERRSVSMVFQSYALWPHMTIAENIGYPLRREQRSKSETQVRVEELLRVTGLGGLGKSRPGELSGGEQQRVALARALARKSNVILFDEPLSNIDASVRDGLKEELLLLQRRYRFSAVYVTHDQSEALSLGSRIAVVNKGRIEEIEEPRALYSRPKTIVGARATGSLSELDGKVEVVDPTTREIVVTTSIGRFVVRDHDAQFVPGQDVVVCWRPEEALISTSTTTSSAVENHVEGVVVLAAYGGVMSEFTVQCNENTRIRGRSLSSASRFSAGDEVQVTLPAEKLLCFPKVAP